MRKSGGQIDIQGVPDPVVVSPRHVLELGGANHNPVKIAFPDLISNDLQLGCHEALNFPYTVYMTSIEVSVMAMNRIQFQLGLSLPEFLKHFGTEPQCAAALEQARWPQGFCCPRCAGGAYSRVRGRNHPLFQCQTCRHQTSLTAGTVMQGTKLPLTLWFLAIYLISQAKTGLSALALKRSLGVSYPTAWLVQHKLMQAIDVCA
jgi:transposase-like protein